VNQQTDIANEKKIDATLKKKNPLHELLYNIIIPTLILNYGGKYLGDKGAVWSLIIALLIPLIYSIYDFVVLKNVNFFGIIGFVSILATGSMALFQVEGNLMILKETLFPLVLGLIVFISAFGKKPFITTVLLNPQVLDVDKLNEKIASESSEGKLNEHLKKSTFLFACSFFLSALLNFYFASRIFIPIDPALDSMAKSQVINEQVAKMTSLGYVFILIPSMVFLILVFWYFFAGLKKMTGLEMKDLLKAEK